MLFKVVSGTVQSQLKICLRDGPLEKLWGGGGVGILHEFFSFNFPLREYFFCTPPPPKKKFPNGPSLAYSDPE